MVSVAKPMATPGTCEPTETTYVRPASSATAPMRLPSLQNSPTALHARNGASQPDATVSTVLKVVSLQVETL